jgi:inorganic triphosphatase YgiF
MPARPPVARPPKPAPAGEITADGRDAGIAFAPEEAVDTAPPGIEIELKLLVDAADMPAFMAAPVIEEHARTRGVRRRLHATYYDTPDARLRRAGLTLRVRQSGRRFVQTVKSTIDHDPLRRGEWEAVVPGMAPDIALAIPFLPPRLGARLVDHPPQPVFSTDIRRLVRTVALPSGTVEVCFDSGTVSAGDAARPIPEIELELKSGSVRRSTDRLRLLEHGAARPRSAASRTRLRSGRRHPPAHPSRAGRYCPRIILDEALRIILGAIFRHLLDALPAALDGGNPEGVHQARVALRRLRSLFGLMREVSPSPSLEAFRAEASRLADGLGNARDTDVFIADTLASVAAVLPHLDGLDGLRAAAIARREALYGESARSPTSRQPLPPRTAPGSRAAGSRCLRSAVGPRRTGGGL